MNLQSDIWKHLDGGYKVPYDASIVLTNLQLSKDENETREIFKELWDELHHQGDVGLASYYSVPSLIEFCLEKKSFDWNYIGICLTIEHCRLSGDNPQLPKELVPKYFESLNKFEQYLLMNLKEIQDDTSFRLALSLVATVNGQRKLGKAILELDDDLLGEFLERF
jgi:hypothetical protein